MSADVIVVGAGVAGVATAFHLSRLGAGDVLVVDRGTAGSGMSSRSSAMIRMHYTFRPEVELAVRSDRMFGSWTELTGRPPFVRRTGFARIVLPGEEQALRANVAMQRDCGARAEVLAARDFAALAPGLRTDDLTEVAWEPDGGYGDGALVAGDLLAAARGRGVRYRPHTPVTALLREGDRVTGIQTQDGPEYAGVVVAAAGVWSPALLSSIGVDLPLETEFHQVAVLSHAPGQGTPVACIDSTTQTYFRPEAGGRMTLVGSFTGPRGVDPDTVAPPAVAARAAADAGVAQRGAFCAAGGAKRSTMMAEAGDGLAELVGAAARRVPALADAGIVRGVTGVYDMTPDGRPMLGEMPGLSGLVLAAGFSGTGFKISPAVGEAVAALVTGRPVAGSVDITPFRPGRFAEGQPVSPPHPYSDE
ncbi:MAG: NAD(P)/FAD-dependent oxidoreductase [Streptosporangiaceae bacterium]